MKELKQLPETEKDDIKNEIERVTIVFFEYFKFWSTERNSLILYKITGFI